MVTRVEHAVADGPPTATYRVQLRDGLTLDDLVERGWLTHIAQLGASHLYLPPLLVAAPGSTHGYDVVDPTRVDPAIGGDEAFSRLAAAARDAGLGLVVDIVPNHMAASPAANPWWWDVLRNGEQSEWADVFDVAARHPEARLQGRIFLPVLDDRYGRVLDAGRFRLVRRDADVVVCIDDRPFPLSPRSLAEVVDSLGRDLDDDRLRLIAAGYRSVDRVDGEDRVALLRGLDAMWADALAEVRLARPVDDELARRSSDVEVMHAMLERQEYRLAHWRAARDLGYRRFFDVNDLIGVRVEDRRVFDLTHAAIASWVASGEVQGVRVDHPDGLVDPAAYFQRLRSVAPAAWIVAEKILEHGEELPPEWEVDGTTGYDVAEMLAQWFVQPDGLRQLGALRDELLGPVPIGPELVAECKRLVLDEMLAADLNRATDDLLRLCDSLRRFRDVTRHDVHEMLREVVIAYPVYRTYVPAHTVAADRDLGLVTAVVAQVATLRPDLDAEVLDLLTSVLTGRLDDVVPEAALVRTRVEQLTGPAMAKGKEDTAFYRDVRLVSRCEVGADPFAGGIDSAGLHAALDRVQRSRPTTMTSLSTHDSKRSEDVRARLNVLTEVPDEWRELVLSHLEPDPVHGAGDGAGRSTSPLSSPADRSVEPKGAALRADDVDVRTRYLLLQTLVGAHPLDADRLGALARKAVREAKDRTSWTRPDPVYESAVDDLVQRWSTDEDLRHDLDRFVASVLEPAARRTSVAQKVLQLTVPGVPDLYWGTEHWSYRLVDPDNRVAPELATLRDALAASVESAQSGDADPEGDLSKVAAVHAVLSLRARRPECFGPRGSYTPLAVDGPDADRVLAFARGDATVTVATRWPARGPIRPGTIVTLPRGPWSVVLGGNVSDAAHDLAAPVDELLGGWSAAVLERDDAAGPS